MANIRGVVTDKDTVLFITPDSKAAIMKEFDIAATFVSYESNPGVLVWTGTFTDAHKKEAQKAMSTQKIAVTGHIFGGQLYPAVV